MIYTPATLKQLKLADLSGAVWPYGSRSFFRQIIFETDHRLVSNLDKERSHSFRSLVESEGVKWRQAVFITSHFSLGLPFACASRLFVILSRLSFSRLRGYNCLFSSCPARLNCLDDIAFAIDLAAVLIAPSFLMSAGKQAFICLGSLR